MQEIQHPGIHALLALTGEALEAPSCFERAIGYAGERRYVSFHVDARSSSVVEDGESIQSGRYLPLVEWSLHLSVWPALAGVGVDWVGREVLGDPEHRIVLDRSTRRLHVGSRSAVRRFLGETLRTRAFRSGPGRNDADAHGVGVRGTGEHGQSAHERSGLDTLAVLLDWLGAQPLPCPSCRRIHAARDFETGESRHTSGENSHPAGMNPTCPSCGELFYGRPLLALVATLRTRGGAPPLLGSVSDGDSVL